MPSKVPSLFPKKSADGKWMYLVEFNSGILKVGVTNDPKYRFRQLHQQEKLRNKGIKRVHLFGKENEWLKREIRAINALGSLAKELIKREYFGGISFDIAIQVVRESQNDDSIPTILVRIGRKDFNLG